MLKIEAQRRAAQEALVYQLLQRSGGWETKHAVSQRTALGGPAIARILEQGVLNGTLLLASTEVEPGSQSAPIYVGLASCASALRLNWDQELLRKEKSVHILSDRAGEVIASFIDTAPARLQTTCTLQAVTSGQHPAAPVLTALFPAWATLMHGREARARASFG